MISVERYNGSSWVDISDYILVEGTGKIPFIDRNSDWSPIASTFDISVSIAFGVPIIRDDKFRFYLDGTIIFAGYADVVTYNYEGRYYVVQVINDLGKLQDLKLDTHNLDTLIKTNGGDLFKYNPDDPVVFETYGANINILWAMKCCFVAAGLVLDTTEIDSVISGTWTTTYGDVDIPFNKLAIDYQAFYSLGQDVATNSSEIDLYYFDSKITLLEFIEWMCKIFRLTLILTDVSNYKVYSTNTLYTIADDNKYAYASKTRLKKSEKAYIAQYAATNGQRYWYYQSAHSSVVKYIAQEDINDNPAPEENEEELSYLNNLIILPYVWDGYDWFPTMIAQGAFPSSQSVSMRQNIRDQAIKDIQTESITTDYTKVVKSVVKNFIDIKNRTSEIEQETYL